MTKWKLASVCALVLAALTGCKSDLTVDAATEEYFGEPVSKTAALRVEVTSCKDRDTGLETSDVLQAKQKVAYIFGDAVKYQTCKRERFESFTEFLVPVTVGGTQETCKADQVCVGNWQKHKITVFVGETVRNKVKTVLKDAMGYSGLEDIQVKVAVPLPANSHFFMPSGFFYDVPIHDGYWTSDKSGKAVIRLSDAAVAMAFSSGYATVIDFLDRYKKGTP